MLGVSTYVMPYDTQRILTTLDYFRNLSRGLSEEADYVLSQQPAADYLSNSSRLLTLNLTGRRSTPTPPTHQQQQQQKKQKKRNKTLAVHPDINTHPNINTHAQKGGGGEGEKDTGGGVRLGRGGQTLAHHTLAPFASSATQRSARGTGGGGRGGDRDKQNEHERDRQNEREGGRHNERERDWQNERERDRENARERDEHNQRLSTRRLLHLTPLLQLSVSLPSLPSFTLHCTFVISTKRSGKGPFPPPHTDHTQTTHRPHTDNTHLYW